MDAATLHAACAAIDAANNADPAKGSDNRAKAILYADGLSRWVATLQPAANPALTIAARGQHLERWVIPRSDYPMDKPSYFRWRKAVQKRQGERAEELLGGIVETTVSTRVGQLVAKAAPAGDADAQTLEDAACLVFLEQEIHDFAAAHGDYSADKYVDILQKTWKKMSEAARQAALGLHLDEPYAGLVKRAVGG